MNLARIYFQIKL